MRRCDQHSGIRCDFALRQHGQMTKKFNVALRALYRREGQVADGHVHLRGKIQKAVEYRLMDGRVTDNSFFSDVFLTGLKLRFEVPSPQAARCAVR